jgi:hypothetical protein
MRSRAVSHLGGEELQRKSYRYMHSIREEVKSIRSHKKHDCQFVEVTLFVHITQRLIRGTLVDAAHRELSPCFSASGNGFGRHAATRKAGTLAIA